MNAELCFASNKFAEAAVGAIDISWTISGKISAKVTKAFASWVILAEAFASVENSFA